MTHKYILDGEPGAGKSTLLAKLRDLGLYTVNEVAQYVKELRVHQKRPTAEQDRAGFQYEVMQTQIRWEKEIPNEIPVAILDRGLYSGIAYYEIEGKQAPLELWNAARSANYAGMLNIKPNKPYKNTAVRSETPELAKELGRRTREIYNKAGLLKRDILAGTLDERVNAVLDQIELGFKGTGRNEDLVKKIRDNHYPGYNNPLLEIATIGYGLNW